MNRVLTPIRVLLVEDCQDDCDLLLLQIRQSGFEPVSQCVETISGIEDALLQEDWQIVFSDFDLPGFDGLLALKMVRARSPEVPFFIVSGIINEEQAVAAIKAGAQDYFFKGNLGRLGTAVTRELHEAEQRVLRREQQAQLDRGHDLLRHDRIRFVDVMSHELRTPLNIINVAAGMLDRYGERMDAPGRHERTVEIQDAVTRMTRIIDKVLLTSRLELRRWDLRAETFNLASWFDEFLLQNTGDLERTHRVRLQLEGLPPMVSMDPRVLEIALQNVLSNALKYSPPDSTVHVEIRAAASGYIQFTVRDSGIGIPEEDLSQVLGSFYRGANVGTVPGTGLGLAIVKACTDLHGGTLQIASEAGQGTTITMSLPNWFQSEMRVA